MEQKVTFCRICEAYCGLVATVEDGRVTQLRPDPDHPLSKGYACPKGIAMEGVQNSPERVLHPLRRGERVSWDEALEDIGERLRGIIAEHGRGSVGWYMGNPGAFSSSHVLWAKGFLDALGSHHYYTAGSQDVNNRFAASALLYGTPLVVPFPDLRRTSFLLMLGANPLVSHGSLLTSPRIREGLLDIVARGGRIVVVDPRRTETARAFEHVPVRPDTDAWLLLSLLHTIFDEGLEHGAALRRQTRGSDQLRVWAAGFAPEETEGRTGVPARTVRRLARDLSGAEAGAVYGRTGSCLGRFGTLVAFLIDALNAATGNLDRRGGAVIGRPPVSLDDVAKRFGLDSYAQRRSRIGGLPDVLGNMPASLMGREIEQRGPGSLRALFVSAGNPVLSVPDGGRLERALGSLDLMVSLDFYVNETNRHADYVLPATTFLERSDIPLASLGFFTTPFIQYTDAVVEPAGEAREEWRVIEAVAASIGVTPSSIRPLRWLGRAGIRFGPDRLLDLLLRTGPERLSLGRLRRHPHGLVLGEHVRTGELRGKLRTPGRRVVLNPAPIGEEIARLRAVNGDGPEYPLRLIGLRELRAHNSWMNRVPKLITGREHALRMHPDDALEAGIAEGDLVRVASKSGAVEVAVRLTEEMSRGTVALPHGRAPGDGGVNVNLLASSAPEDLEPLAGMAFLNGIPVRVEPVAPASPAGAAARRSSPLPTAP